MKSSKLQNKIKHDYSNITNGEIVVDVDVNRNSGYDRNGKHNLKKMKKQKTLGAKMPSKSFSIFLSCWLLFIACSIFYTHYSVSTFSGGHDGELSKEEKDWLVISGLQHFERLPYKRGKEVRKMKNIHQSESKKPKLYLHIGPPKMGTTTLQHYLKADDESGVLAMSNYTYFECPKLQKMYAPITGQNFTNWVKFMNCLEDARAKGHHLNAVYSQEVFGKFLTDSPHHWRNLERVTKDWDVVIVLSYRRFFEWLPSYYYQNNRIMNCKHKCKPPTFHEYFEMMKEDNSSIYAHFWGGVLGERHPTEAMKEKFGKHFDNILLHNIHEEPENLVANFYCNILNATEACLVRRKEGLEVSKNIGSTLNYALLATAAKDKELVPKRIPRFQVSKAAKEFQESLNRTELDFPLTCITKEDEEWLLATSQKFEHRLLGQAITKRTKDEHQTKFENALKKKKYCNLDAEKAISDKMWIEFFTQWVQDRDKNRTEASDNNEIDIYEWLTALQIGDRFEYNKSGNSGESNWVTYYVSETQVLDDKYILKTKSEKDETVELFVLKPGGRNVYMKHFRFAT